MSMQDFILNFDKSIGLVIGDYGDERMGQAKVVGRCGSSYSCSGGGGQCGSSYDCAGGGGRCGSSYSCSGQ